MAGMDDTAAGAGTGAARGAGLGDRAGLLGVVGNRTIALERGVFERRAQAEAARRGWTARFTWCDTSDAEAVRAGCEGADALLILPGEAVGLVDVCGLDVSSGHPFGSLPTVRFDLGGRTLDPDPGIVHHLRGLGVEGTPWAVAAAIAAAVHPAERTTYGPDPDQFGEWRPAGDGRAPLATAVLLHGGFYRSRWQVSLMDWLAIDLAKRGWATWNVEYRRPDAHGWVATVSDVHASIVALRDQPDFDASAPVVVFGHSAGGQLAIQVAEELAAARSLPASPAAARTLAAPPATRTTTASPAALAAAAPPSASVGVDLAVSLAGIVDLVAAHERYMGEGAVRMALGGSPAELPEVYAAASPNLLPVRRVPWLLVEGTDDSSDIADMNERLAASEKLGHPELLQEVGHHFSVIDPSTPIWRKTVGRVTELIGHPRPAAGA